MTDVFEHLWLFVIYIVVIGWLVYVRSARKKRLPVMLNYQEAIDGEQGMKAIAGAIYASGSDRERLERVADVVDAWMLSRPK